jgi:hypothetical protein
VVEVQRTQFLHAELTQLLVSLARHHMIDIEHAAMFAQRGEASKIYLLGEELPCKILRNKLLDFFRLELYCASLDVQ